MKTHITLPIFSDIQASTLKKTLAQKLKADATKYEALLQRRKFTWENLLEPIEAMEETLNHFFSRVSHLQAVMDTKELRKAYESCLPLLSEFSANIYQNKKLYEAILSVKQSRNFSNLSKAQQKSIEHRLLDFKRSGVDLDTSKKSTLKKLQKESSLYAHEFSAHLLDATQAWFYHTTEAKLLKGLPAHTLALAQEAAAQKNLKGFVLTLDYPVYDAVMHYAEHRPLREAFYQAYVTRASDQGPNAGKFDNTALMEKTLENRREYAHTLGFSNYAELSLERKMAKTPEEVLGFLESLVASLRAKAATELADLQKFSKKHCGLAELKPWDLTYASTKYKEHLFKFNPETLREYFPEDHVLKGLFKLTEKLYSVKIEEISLFPSWEKSVRLFKLKKNNGQIIGYFYTDLYARAHKNSGAWMSECQNRRRDPAGTLQLPIAFLNCNFDPPLGAQKSLLTHEQVTTLFHEFGHTLHHLLTKIEVASVAGINGVARDAVELPSQIMELWCFEPASLKLISKHHKTRKPLDKKWIDTLIASRNFQAALWMLRQLEFALFDFKLHLSNTIKTGAEIQALLDDIRKQTAILPQESYNRFQHSFCHIFAGGYAAGYYGYLWADVLAADAFSAFLETSIFDTTVAKRFRDTILSQGGSVDALDLFVKFRGREPDIRYMLKLYDIPSTPSC